MEKLKAVRLVVRGTQHYNTIALYNDGKIRVNDPISLVAEPENKHDRNAVAVYLKTQEKIGHIAADIAERYQAYVRSGMIKSAIISNTELQKSRCKIELRVEIFSTQGVRSLSKKISPKGSMGSYPGVYQIDLGFNRIYIGSTSDLSRRLKQHNIALRAGKHANPLIQKDFDNGGGALFSFTVVKIHQDASDALESESRVIRQFLADGKALYNLTEDGQGRVPDPSGDAEPISVSDRRNDWRYSSFVTLDKFIGNKEILNNLMEGNRNLSENSGIDEREEARRRAGIGCLFWFVVMIILIFWL